MREIELKYGCNPNQKPSKVYMENGSDFPIEVLNGRPGYINLLDALNGWQLVSELKRPQDFLQLHPSSTYHLLEQQLEQSLQILRRRYTG